MGMARCSACGEMNEGREMRSCQSCGAMSCQSCGASNQGMCSYCYSDLNYMN